MTRSLTSAVQLIWASIVFTARILESKALASFAMLAIIIPNVPTMYLRTDTVPSRSLNKNDLVYMWVRARHPSTRFCPTGMAPGPGAGRHT